MLSLLALAIGACGTRAASTAAAGSASPARSELASIAPTRSAVPSRPTPDIAGANQAIAERLRIDGRASFAMCLYVDPATGIDARRALADTQDALDALVRRGYTALASRVSPCLEAPLYIRTGTVHFKNSGNGDVAPLPHVAAPSPQMLVIALTTPSRIDAIFGGTIRRGAEEIVCAGDNCWSVTESIYADPTGFADPFTRETLILEGLGLLGR